MSTENIIAEFDWRVARPWALLLSVPIVIWVYVTLGPSLLGLGWMIFGLGLLLLALIDAQTKLLPDVLTLPLMWLGIVMQLFDATRTVGLEASVWGVLVGYLPLWILAHLYVLIRHREGLGMGDLKLLAAMGAWSGPVVIPGVIFLSSLMAIFGVLAIRLLHRQKGSLSAEFPFGPWIIIAYMTMVVSDLKISLF